MNGTTSYLDKFKNEISFSELAQGTEYRYIRTVQHYLEFADNNPDFTREELMDFINSLGKTTSTYKSWCIRILKRFYEAVNQPWPMRRREGPRTEIRPQPYLKPGDITKLLELAKDSKRDSAIIQLFTDTLMRRDEMAKLDRSHCNGKELLIKLSKGEEYRTVELTRETRQSIDSYLRSRRDSNPALFLSNKNGRLSQEGISSIIRNYLRKAGIYKARLGSHGFRRGGVTDLAGKGVPDLTIAKWGGWKSTAMIQRYAQLSPSSVEKEIRAASPLRGKNA